MKDRALAEDFLAIFAADTTHFPSASVNLQPGQSTDDLKLEPHLIVFDLRSRPVDAIGNILAYLLSVTVETDPRFGDTDQAAAHATLVELVREKFFGVATANVAAAKAAMKAAMHARGHFDLRNYDTPPETETAPAADTHRFRTIVPVAGIAISL